MDTITALKKKLEVIRGMQNRVQKPKKYCIPPLYLLKDYEPEIHKEPLDSKALEDKISEFGFESSTENISKGPLITRYEIKLAKGVRISQIKNITEDLAIALGNKIRILAPIPGTSLIGIEIANKRPSIIGFKDIISEFDGKAKLPIVLGTDTIGKPQIVDLAKMPHLLVAGQTGSGKSVFLNAIILSLLYTRRPDEVQLAMVDPKRVEMAFYKNIPHLMWPIVTEAADALELFSALIKEMENRYQMLYGAQVRNIEGYNSISQEKMPYIVTLVDEMADLMMTSGKELETMIVRLAQLSRAVGIHLVLATQKPIVKVITGLIKSNMPSRISFEVASKMDSRVILDCNGAESLIGRGDMLMLYPGATEPERFHGAWVSDGEITAITKFMEG